MSRTLSKQKRYRKSCTILNQRTEKKTGNSIEISSVVKSSIWVNKQKISLLIQEGAKSQSFFNELKYFDNDTKVQKKYLRIVNPTHIRINRGRIFDWLLDVCRAFELRWETYWCAIQIIDFLIFVADFVKVSNILMTAVTCLFMASKIHQTNPPSLHRIIQKAVYNTFSYSQVLNLQSTILLKTSNSETKPRYLQTIYNTLYQLYPRLPQRIRLETIRRLILIWMDPVVGLSFKKKTQQICEMYVSYEDLVIGVVKAVEEDEQTGGFKDVYLYFKGKFQCDNLDAGWPGMLRIRE